MTRRKRRLLESLDSIQESVSGVPERSHNLGSFTWFVVGLVGFSVRQKARTSITKCSGPQG
jgi:hypothetical protein